MMGNGEVDTGTALSLANAPATVTIVIGTVPVLIPPLALSNIAAAHAPAPLLVAEGILTPLMDTAGNASVLVLHRPRLHVTVMRIQNDASITANTNTDIGVVAVV